MGGDTSWQEAYSDPLRFLPDGATEELRLRAPPRPEEVHNEHCSVKFLMVHRPTHDAERDKSGEYPMSWHLADRRRLWEARFQVRFKKVPQSGLFFGVELGQFVPVSTMTKQAQKALVSACQRIVGECYHTSGDDPAAAGGREVEPPAFVMPLWAFDQFHIAESGREPPLDADLSGLGFCRSEGASKYIASLKEAAASFSTELVYTFCFWGISKFLDIIRWEVVGGIMPGMKMDFDKLCGAPPVYFSLYELRRGDSAAPDDGRHVPSRKRVYFRSAVWSAARPPQADPASMAAVALQSLRLENDSCPSGGGGLAAAAQAAPACEDLLGFFGEAPAASAPAQGCAAKAQEPAAAAGCNVDLLGLL